MRKVKLIYIKQYPFEISPDKTITIYFQVNRNNRKRHDQEGY